MKLKNRVLRTISLGLLVASGSVPILASSAKAEQWVDLDVHRHCQSSIRAGDQWNGMQFTSNGWHHYGGGGRHYCGVMAQRITVVTNQQSGSIGATLGLPGVGGGNTDRTGSRSTSYTQLGPNQRQNLDVWYDRACEKQGGNGRYRVNGNVVTCQR